MNMPSEPHLVPGRACGTCMMCCKVPYIKAFEKPAGVWCAHAAAGKGCAIYASRPDECRAFYCLWMQDASFGPEWKPEKAKFVTYIQQNGVNIQVAVDPSFPNAWMREPYYARIKQWAREGAAGVATDTAGAVARLPATRVIAERATCPVAPNGAPDCRLAAETVCRSHGFASGSSVDFQTVEKCPPVALNRPNNEPAVCVIESYVTRALCSK